MRLMLAEQAGDPFGVSGGWYKGNLHGHSTNSDGRKTPSEAVGWYRDHGYDFVALTDHRLVTDTSAFDTHDFVTVRGMELDGMDDHPHFQGRYTVVGLGMRTMDHQPEPWRPEMSIEMVKSDGGLVMLSHPYWIGWTLERLRRLGGFVGMEVFDSVTDRLNNKGFAGLLWDGYLDRVGPTWGFAVDDSHWIYAEEGRGWVMVRSPELSQEALLEAIRRGHFYASMGPEIEAFGVSDGVVGLRCSPARRISLMATRSLGASYLAPPGDSLTQAQYELCGDESYVRAEIEDTEGRMAWTNPLFV